MLSYIKSRLDGYFLIEWLNIDWLAKNHLRQIFIMHSIPFFKDLIFCPNIYVACDHEKRPIFKNLKKWGA